MILKNEIPILEFDTDKTAVIMPTHENIKLNLPRKAVFAFLDEHIEKYAKTHNGLDCLDHLSTNLGQREHKQYILTS